MSQVDPLQCSMCVGERWSDYYLCRECDKKCYICDVTGDHWSSDHECRKCKQKGHESASDWECFLALIERHNQLTDKYTELLKEHEILANKVHDLESKDN